MKQGDKYMHYKGEVYTYIKEGTNAETGQKLVAYQDKKGALWFRPTELFHGPVVVRNKVVKRFVKLGGS